MRDNGTVSGSECERAGRAIEDLGEGRIGKVRWMLLRRHVKDCPECGTFFDRMSAVVDALSELQRAEAPEEFAALVMALLIEALGGRPAEAAELVNGSNRNLFIVAAAAVLGLAIGLVLAVLRRWTGRHGDEELAAVGQA